MADIKLKTQISVAVCLKSWTLSAGSQGLSTGERLTPETDPLWNLQESLQQPGVVWTAALLQGGGQKKGKSISSFGK